MKVHAAPNALIALIAALMLGSAHASVQDAQRDAASTGWLGKPAAAAAAPAKAIDVSTVSTLTVDCGDVVTFRNGDKSFSWKFEVPSHGRVALKAIAPADFNAPDLFIYVSRSESERS